MRCSRLGFLLHSDGATAFGEASGRATCPRQPPDLASCNRRPRVPPNLATVDYMYREGRTYK